VRLARVYAAAQTIELLRYPSFSVPTLLMPGVVFEIVGAHLLHVPANLVMVSYAAFAVLGVAFFQFGVGVAAERISPWHTFLRVLPAPAYARFVGRIVAALVFGLGSAATVCALALATTGASLTARQWLAVLTTLLVGAIPFALLGIAIGYALSPRGALPAANMLYLGMAYLGGLFAASPGSSGFLGSLRPYLPTHAWLELLGSAAGVRPFEGRDVIVLLVSGVVFATLASWGYRRDEGQRFR
jgi:ABC-2 type transport system permease protein